MNGQNLFLSESSGVVLAEPHSKASFPVFGKIFRRGHWESHLEHVQRVIATV
jgi:hypothetical protein